MLLFATRNATPIQRRVPLQKTLHRPVFLSRHAKLEPASETQASAMRARDHSQDIRLDVGFQRAEVLELNRTALERKAPPSPRLQWLYPPSLQNS